MCWLNVNHMHLYVYDCGHNYSKDDYDLYNMIIRCIIMHNEYIIVH